jgi:hypothetical protein
LQGFSAEVATQGWMESFRVTETVPDLPVSLLMGGSSTGPAGGGELFPRKA